MYFQREEAVHICFVQDKEADGKRHINGRPAQGEKLLGDPAAVQSPTIMVQATGVRLSPAIDREEQTTNREKIKRKAKLLTNSRCAETSGRSFAFPTDLPYCVYNFATLKSLTHVGVPIVTSQSGLSSLPVGGHSIAEAIS